MRRLMGVALLVLIASGATWAASYVGFEQITVAGTALGFTSGKITPAGLPMATYASCRLETAEIRWTVDGTVPTASVGTPLEPGDTIELNGHDLLMQFRAIRTTSTSAVLNCTYVAP